METGTQHAQSSEQRAALIAEIRSLYRQANALGDKLADARVSAHAAALLTIAASEILHALQVAEFGRRRSIAGVRAIWSREAEDLREASHDSEQAEIFIEFSQLFEGSTKRDLVCLSRLAEANGFFEEQDARWAATGGKP